MDFQFTHYLCSSFPVLNSLFDTPRVLSGLLVRHRLIQCHTGLIHSLLITRFTSQCPLSQCDLTFYLRGFGVVIFLIIIVIPYSITESPYFSERMCLLGKRNVQRCSYFKNHESKRLPTFVLKVLKDSLSSRRRVHRGPCALSFPFLENICPHRVQSRHSQLRASLPLLLATAALGTLVARCSRAYSEVKGEQTFALPSCPRKGRFSKQPGRQTPGMSHDAEVMVL